MAKWLPDLPAGFWDILTCACRCLYSTCWSFKVVALYTIWVAPKEVLVVNVLLVLL